MLIPNHPHDERLSALASGDPDAVADSALTEHVATCVRCTDTVAQLGAIRASLAELPDLRPHRPLQLLPPVPDVPERADRVGGWARRLFGPMLTAGAALALVGLVGTTWVGWPPPAQLRRWTKWGGPPSARRLMAKKERMPPLRPARAKRRPPTK